jgi:hypothetical protein
MEVSPFPLWLILRWICEALLHSARVTEPSAMEHVLPHLIAAL